MHPADSVTPRSSITPVDLPTDIQPQEHLDIVEPPDWASYILRKMELCLQENYSLQADLQRAKACRKVIQDRIDMLTESANRAVVSHRDEMQKLRRENAVLQDQIDDLKRRLEFNIEQVKRHEQEIEALQRDNRQLNMLSAIQTAQISEMREALRRTDDQFKQHAETIAELANQVNHPNPLEQLGRTLTAFDRRATEFRSREADDTRVINDVLGVVCIGASLLIPPVPVFVGAIGAFYLLRNQIRTVMRSSIELLLSPEELKRLTEGL